MSCLACHLGQTASVSSLSSGCCPLTCSRPACIRVVACLECSLAARWLSAYEPRCLCLPPIMPHWPCLQALAGEELAYLAYSPQGSNHTQTAHPQSDASASPPPPPNPNTHTQTHTSTRRCVMTNDKAVLNHRCPRFDPSPMTLSIKLFMQPSIGSHQSQMYATSFHFSQPPLAPRHPSIQSTLFPTSGENTNTSQTLRFLSASPKYAQHTVTECVALHEVICRCTLEAAPWWHVCSDISTCAGTWHGWNSQAH